MVRGLEASAAARPKACSGVPHDPEYRILRKGFSL